VDSQSRNEGRLVGLPTPEYLDEFILDSKCREVSILLGNLVLIMLPRVCAVDESACSIAFSPLQYLESHCILLPSIHTSICALSSLSSGMLHSTSPSEREQSVILMLRLTQ